MDEQRRIEWYKDRLREAQEEQELARKVAEEARAAHARADLLVGHLVGILKILAGQDRLGDLVRRFASDASKAPVTHEAPEPAASPEAAKPKAPAPKYKPTQQPWPEIIGKPARMLTGKFAGRTGGRVVGQGMNGHSAFITGSDSQGRWRTSAGLAARGKSWELVD